MSATDPVLAVEGVRKAYGGRVAVDGVSFAVARGECFGLLGPNGAGKSTTAAMAAGLLRPDAGRVLVGGDDVAAAGAASRRRLGLVPQELAVYDDLTASENLSFFGALYGLRGEALAAGVAAALAAAGLEDRARDRVKTFSGGMKRRLNVAAGLVHGPSLVLLDEPTVGVDPQSRNRLFDMVEALLDRGVAVVYTTHYMEEAERLCDRIGVMDRGRLVAVGTRDELVGGLDADDEAEFRFAADEAPDEARAREVFGPRARRRDDGAIATPVRGVAGLQEALAAATRAALPARSVTLRKPDLETVFLALTGRALRDGREEGA